MFFVFFAIRHSPARGLGTDRVLANRLKRLFAFGAPHTGVCRFEQKCPSEGHFEEKRDGCERSSGKRY